MRTKMAARIPGAFALLGMAFGLPQTAQAETKTFVVSYFAQGMYNKDGDCPGGLNPPGEGLFRQILRDKGYSQADIDKLADDKWETRYKDHATFRGTLNGKPADVYLHPMSVPDPKVNMVGGKEGVGFNLDGADGPDDFTDPLTGETGVDNNLFRVLGCNDRVRGTPTSHSPAGELYWNGSRDGMPAWLIQVSGVDDVKNDDDVEVTIYRALERAARSVTSGVQTDMSYTVDTDRRMMNNRFRGKIRDGMFVSDQPASFWMLSDLRIQPLFDLKQAKLRLKFQPDGTIDGFIGGFAPWSLTYLAYVSGRASLEASSGISAPGLYHGLRKMADTDIDKDPRTGMRTRISATFQIFAVPAFFKPVESTPGTEAKTAKGGKPLAMADERKTVR